MLEYPILQYTHGVFVYSMDDAYIRMAIGKNLAFHGIWGLSPTDFVPASSSILYPLVLAVLYKVSGPYTAIPFILNLAAAIMLLVVIRNWLLRQELRPLSQLLILLAVVFLTPLPTMVCYGMEHTLQILFSFLFVYKFCEWNTVEVVPRGARRFLPWQVYLYALLLVATRYEGLFLVVIACIFVLFRHRLLPAISLGLLSLLPAVIFGIYSVQHGGYILPNSILLKSPLVPFNEDVAWKFFTTEIVNNLLYQPPSRGAVAAERLLIVLPLVYWLYRDGMRQNKLYKQILLMCLAACILHLLFANAIVYYRYEAYLLACCIPVIGVLIARYKKMLSPSEGVTARWVAIWTGIVLLFPILSRSWHGFLDNKFESLHQYEQDYQAAVFINKYYDHATVMIDDAGAVSYLSDAKKMDLIDGIGDMEVTKSKVESYARIEFTDFLITRGKPGIAIISERKYNPWLLRNWQKIASWQTRNRVALLGTELTFYAVDKTAGPQLKKNLQAFQPRLPSGVTVTYY